MAKLSKEEAERRKELNLPMKPLRYMKLKSIDSYEKIEVEEDKYKIVKTLEPSGTHILEVSLATGEKVIIMADYFRHMQKESFVEDMLKALKKYGY